MTSAIRFARLLTLAGLGLLIAVLVIWHAWLSPPAALPVALVMAIVLVPLLLATPGLLRGRTYTHAWVSLLSLFYFILAVDGVAAGVEPHWLPAAALTASVALFTGAVVYVRARGNLRRRATTVDSPDASL